MEATAKPQHVRLNADEDLQMLNTGMDILSIHLPQHEKRGATCAKALYIGEAKLDGKTIGGNPILQFTKINKLEKDRVDVYELIPGGNIRRNGEGIEQINGSNIYVISLTDGETHQKLKKQLDEAGL
tara:strand:- start:914 stop:1294 length:381 start_codon:yes stop_codon:yes gene_type:complete